MDVDVFKQKYESTNFDDRYYINYGPHKPSLFPEDIYVIRLDFFFGIAFVDSIIFVFVTSNNYC